MKIRYKSSSIIQKAFLTLFSIFALLQNGVSKTDEFDVLTDLPLYKHFDSRDYNGGIQSWFFDQDGSGILYVANNDGLLEFDGNKWIKYIVPYCTKVRAVKVDSRNRIFVGGQGQIGYFNLSDTGLVFTSLLKLLPVELQNIAETWKIIEHDNKIFFYTEGQLFVLHKDELHVLELPGYLRQVCKVENKLIIQFYGQGLFEFVNGEFIPVKNTEDLPDLISIIKVSDGYYYFSRSGNLYKHDEAGVTLIELKVDLGRINDVVKVSSGEYAIGTQNNGLFFLNPDLSFKQHLTKNEGLSDRTIKSIYEDQFHNLWIALNNGIDYLELSLPLSLINEEVGLEGTGYAACKFNNRIYLGTSNGLFVQNSFGNSSSNKKYKLVPGSEGQVYKFSIVNNELILNHNRGAFQIKEIDLVQFHDVGSWKFMETSKPGYILGGDYQGIKLYNKINNRWTRALIIPNFFESSRIMEYENDSTLWMTHGSKGAYRLKFDKNMSVKGKVEYFGKDKGFPSNIKISVYSLNGKLIFTSENGIYNFNNDSYSFVPNSFFNKWLGKEHISAIISNGSNAIFYIQEQRFGLLKQETFGSYQIETGLFKHINKLLNDDLPNITILDEQNVLIGAKEGFIKYNVDKDFIINTDFKVLIRSIEIQSSNDSSITYYSNFHNKKEIEINQSVKFNYAAPFFDGFEDVNYSYRLVPFNNNWSSWSTLGEKEYPYLPSGEYTFEVKAMNIYENESSLVSFQFRVLKPWYFSSIAILAYLIIGLIFIGFVLLIQRRKYIKEKSEIVKNKEQALETKDEEINKLSIESKSEIARLNNEKLRTEIDLKNDQLTTITLNLMKKNEFMQDIRKKINLNIKNGGSEEELKRLIKTIDEDLSNNESWDQFAYHFDQVHGDYLKKLSKNNIRLSPREIKLAAFLRMNMSSKEISNLMNITVRSVELARHRLRKKLRLDRDQNLVEYLIELDSK